MYRYGRNTDFSDCFKLSCDIGLQSSGLGMAAWTACLADGSLVVSGFYVARLAAFHGLLNYEQSKHDLEGRTSIHLPVDGISEQKHGPLYKPSERAPAGQEGESPTQRSDVSNVCFE